MEKVLIVEDEKLIRQGIKSMILRSGVSVQTIIECNNGEKALEILKEQEIDIMFTDIRMPKMDGIALVQNMQTLRYKPLTVVISGYDEFDYAVEMLRNGVREYLLKPVEREQILSIMQTLEQEIQEKKKEQDEKQQIGYQQLRHLCVKGDISQIERELICKQYGDIFLQGKYVVCCSSCEEDTDEFQRDFIYLKDVGEHQVFLIGSDEKELLDCYSGYSEVFSELINLDIAYTQACIARKRAFSQCIKLVTYDTSMGMSDEENDLTAGTVQQLEAMVHMLGTNRVDEIAQAIRTIVEDVRNGRVSVDYFCKQMTYFTTHLEKNYENVLKTKCESVLELKQMYRYKNIVEFSEELIKKLKVFSELIHEELDDYKTKQKVQLALGYIHENYNKDLNMAVVSNHISMNYSLFSQVFKQYTGKNFVNYLKELRMKEAKRLLEETDMRIIEISVAVGYENEKHFMKLFKSDCGVSPTEYRKSIMLKNEK